MNLQSKGWNFGIESQEKKDLESMINICDKSSKKGRQLSFLKHHTAWYSLFVNDSLNWYF